MVTRTIRIAKWVASHAGLAALVGIELGIVILVGVPFLANNLQRHDLIGHFASAAFTDQFLFPAPTGYNPFYFCGAPQNLLYPPLLAYAASALGRLVGVALALKLLVLAAVLGTPLTTYWCARAHAIGRGPAAVGTLLVTASLALDSRELGGNFVSTFEIGNATNALGLPLVLAYAAALARQRRRPRAIVLPTVLLAVNLTTHLVGGMVSGALLLMHLLDSLRKRYAVAARVGGWLVLHGIWALVLASFFVVPMLVFRRFGSPDNRSYDQYPDSVLLLLTSIGILVCWYSNRRRSQVAPLAMTSWLLVLFHAFVFNDVFPLGLGLHVHRFKLYDMALLTLIGAWLVDGWTSAMSRGARELLGFGVGVSTFACLVVGLSRIDARGVPNQVLPPLPRLNSRVMVMSAPHRQVSDHTLQHLVAMRSGNLVGKGLFIETAANGRFIVDLELLLAADPNGVRTWGVELDAPERLETLRPRLLRLLELFGFGYVLANEPLRADAGLLPLRDLGAGFTLYRANGAELAEVWRGPVVGVPARNFVGASRAWFFGNHEYLGVESSPERSIPSRPIEEIPNIAQVGSVHVDARAQMITIDVRSETPVPVLVKFTYAPQWQAFDASGRRIELYRATPNFMLVVGRGKLSLRYVRTSLERQTVGVSALAALLLLVLAVARPFGKRT